MDPSSASRQWASVFTALSLALGLAGCAMYHARPLPVGPDVQADVSRLSVDVARLRVGPLKPVVVDARDGLDPLEVAVLAVLNSPELRAKRVALGVQSAQVFQAGLLPEPQISVSVDKPVSGPDTQTAYSVSPSIDLQALLSRSNTLAAARFTRKQA